jgi:hypothetical protein
MPFVPVANTALVEIRLEQDDQQVENTLWWEFPSDPTPAELDTLVSGIFGWWVDNVQTLTSTSVTMREIVATSQTTATSAQVSFTPPTLVDGTNTSPPMPNNVTLTVSFRTALRGRSFRGRNYTIGMVDAQIEGNTVLPGTVSAWQDAYEALIAIQQDVGAVWVVASRFSGVDADGKPIPRAAGVTTPIISVVVVDDISDSQRRRLPGRGR